MSKIEEAGGGSATDAETLVAASAAKGSQRSPWRQINPWRVAGVAILIGLGLAAVELVEGYVQLGYDAARSPIFSNLFFVAIVLSGAAGFLDWRHPMEVALGWLLGGLLGLAIFATLAAFSPLSAGPSIWGSVFTETFWQSGRAFALVLGAIVVGAILSAFAALINRMLGRGAK